MTIGKSQMLPTKFVIVSAMFEAFTGLSKSLFLKNSHNNNGFNVTLKINRIMKKTAIPFNLSHSIGE